MNWHIQLFRYGLVGLTSNAFGFLLYLVLTYAGMGHKTAMSLLYGVGVLQTFYFNRRWTFGHNGPNSTAFARYVVTYAVGYLVNLVVLIMLVDRWDYPHQGVQAGMVVIVAAFLFIAQRYWVFAVAGQGVSGKLS